MTNKHTEAELASIIESYKDALQSAGSNNSTAPKTIGYMVPLPHPGGICPTCGHCPTCGRGGYYGGYPWRYNTVTTVNLSVSMQPGEYR